MAVARVLDSLFLTTGAEVGAFEQEFATFLGIPHVAAVTSCTEAEHLVLRALGVGPGDEVITTPMTFIASATAIIHAGATPVFADVDPDTGNIDPVQVEAAVTSRTKAIVAVHLYGTMCDMRALRAVADRYHLFLIEDCAHCVEGSRDGIRPGELGDAACFSFYATKTLTCGEGGAVAVHDSRLDDRLRELRLHGMTKGAADRYGGLYQHWDMVELGYKSNMTNISAAMLRPQLPRLHARRDRREEISLQYDTFVDSRPWIGRPRVPAGACSARHLYTVWVDPSRRDRLLAWLGSHGVGCAVNYRAIHRLSWLGKNIEPGLPLPVAERIGDSTLSLPLYDRLTDAEVGRVCEVLDLAGREP